MNVDGSIATTPSTPTPTTPSSSSEKLRLSVDHVDAMVEALALKRLAREGLIDVLQHAGDIPLTYLIHSLTHIHTPFTD